jgi:hypothetical protein
MRFVRESTCPVSALLLKRHIQNIVLDLPRYVKLSACTQCALIVKRSAAAQQRDSRTAREIGQPELRAVFSQQHLEKLLKAEKAELVSERFMSGWVGKESLGRI